jgi:hypothetical protein
VVTSAAAVVVGVELVPAGVEVTCVAVAGGELAAVVALVLLLLPQPAASMTAARVLLQRATVRFT